MLWRLLFFPLVLVVRLLLAPLRALRRASASPKGALVEIRLRGRVREGPAKPKRLWPPRLLVARAPRPEVRLQPLRRVIDEAIADPRVAGVVLTIDGVEAGWATLEALRAELARIRAANKRVCAWLPSGIGNREMFVASAADTILAAPTSDVAFVGIKAEAHYVRRALERLGVDFELHARKEFKSAGDRVARDGRSEGDRLQTTVIVDGVDAALIEAVAAGRRMSEGEVRAAMDLGPTHARAALARRLVDHVCHDDELPTVLGAPVIPADRWYARRRSGRDARPLFPKPVIGVVEVHGAITSASAPISGVMGPVALADRVVADLRLAERDPRIAAVIVDVDSPGGTVLASDVIGAAVRRVAAKKPVFARMGDVAASGGYWVACEARAIVARPLTLTGSIGVVAVRPVAARLAERLGVVRDVIANGKYADLDAVTRPPRDDERELFAREIDQHYDTFVEHVARARNKSKHAIEEVARGRVWLGRDGAHNGLVDQLGGFDLAVELARAAVEKPLDPEPRRIVAPLPSRRHPLPEATRVLASLLALLPEGLAAELAPIVAALEAGARVAVVASPDRLR